MRDFFDTRIVCAKGWNLVVSEWFVLSMHKKGEFRNRTTR